MLEAIKKFFKDALNRISFRMKQAHYASSALRDLRDQYWEWTGEPETNPRDFKSHMTLAIGEAIEYYLCSVVFPKLSLFGYHLLAYQVPVEGYEPHWHGYMDALLVRDDVFYVVEIKTKHGFGADLLYDKLDVSQDHLAQLGLYLMACHEQEVPAEGLLLYVLLSDKHFGDIILIDCTYNPQTKVIKAYRATDSSGRIRSIDHCNFNVKYALERFKLLDQYLAKGEVPPPDYQYKKEITWENVKSIPDSKLKKIVEGTLIYGDWQPKYSVYKDKIIEVDGIKPEHSDEEKQIALAEYRRRKPRTTLKLKGGKDK